MAFSLGGRRSIELPVINNDDNAHIQGTPDTWRLGTEVFGQTPQPQILVAKAEKQRIKPGSKELRT